MTTPYTAIRQWVVPDAAGRATLAGVRTAGLHGNESGAFWLGVRARVAIVTAVILPRGKGVEENPGEWRVRPEVFGAISRWARPRALTLLGVAHTHVHGVPARLSWADRHRSVRVPGILAVVIGNCGADDNLGDWGWYVYDVSDYREILRTELEQRVRANGPEPVEVWRADSDGLWPVATA